MEVHDVTADAETFTCNAYLARAEPGSVPGSSEPTSRDEGARTALVDAGAMDGVVEAIREHVDELDLVALTHQHGDHVAQLDAVCEAFDPEVYAAADHPRRTHAIEDGDTVRIGDETFDVVATPGHADDHVSFVSQTTLFSGDVVVHDDGAFDYGSFGRTDRPGQSREALIESIERLLERMPEGVRASEASAGSADERSEPAGVEHMYAGHGDAFHGDVRDVVKTALGRAEKREPKYPDE